MSSKGKLARPNVDQDAIDEMADKAAVVLNEKQEPIYKTLPLPLTRKQYNALRKKAAKEQRSMTYFVKKYAEYFTSELSKV